MESKSDDPSAGFRRYTLHLSNAPALRLSEHPPGAGFKTRPCYRGWAPPTIPGIITSADDHEDLPDAPLRRDLVQPLGLDVRLDAAGDHVADGPAFGGW